MVYAGGVVVNAQVTFGRDSAMFEGLLDFVAQLSLGVWALVIITIVMRFVGIRAYGRAGARTAPRKAMETAGSNPPAGRPTAPVTIDFSQPVEGQSAGSGLVRLGLLEPTASMGDAMAATPGDGSRTAVAHAAVSRRTVPAQRSKRGTAARVPELTASSTEA